MNSIRIKRYIRIGNESMNADMGEKENRTERKQNGGLYLKIIDNDQ